MRICLVLVAAAVMACGGKSKPRETSSNNDQCFYGCKKDGKPDDGYGSTAATPPPPPAPGGKLTPSGEKAVLLRQAADLLDKAGDALTNGNKNLAEQLFSNAELIVG